ncbi:MAG: 2-oxoacid:acceptor oxidoreductase family protein [Planctomycetota bacterium]|jgi:2-oxoglutarate ferredoxin oxidoreductase subunit gamma
MYELRVTGFGGQGIIRTGMIIGKALSLHGGMHATLTQAFGPEARGSACSAQVVIDEVPVLYPYVTKTDFLVAMSQEGYSKFCGNLRDEGTLIIDKDLVIPDEAESRETFAIPATRIAEELGVKIAANLVMIGFFCAVTPILDIEAVRQAIPGTVPERFLALNLEALQRGYDYGQSEYGAAEKVAAEETEA